MLSLFTVGAFAQPEKGKWYVGTANLGMGFAGTEEGTFVTGFSKFKNGDVKTTMYGLAPEAGYYITDKVSLGVGIYYNHLERKNGDLKQKNELFGFNVYGRYYMCGTDKFNFYMQAGFDLANNNPHGAESNTYWAAGVNPGISYALSERFTLTGAFGFLGYQKFASKNDAFGLDLDFNTLQLGLNIKL